MSLGKNTDRLAYRSSAQTVRFAWRTVILAIVFGSAVFVIVPLVTSKPVKEEKMLFVQPAPAHIKMKVPEKEKIFERKKTENILPKKKQPVEPVRPSIPVPKAAPVPIKLSNTVSEIKISRNEKINTRVNFDVEKIQAIDKTLKNPIEVKEVPPEVIPSKDYSAVFSASEVDSDAMVVRRPRANYPKLAQRRGVTGYVKINCVITKEGDIINPVVVESKPKGYFEQSCLDVLHKIKYKPAMLDGKPVAQRLELNFDFDLQR